MSKNVESCADMGPIGAIRRYLFFGNELVIGDSFSETHSEILKSSGKTKKNVLVAGGYAYVQEDAITIDGNGSTSLNILSDDPTPVVEFVKRFPDVTDKLILPV